MAKLSKEDILKLAKLSRLQLTEEEVASFSNEISAILQYVEQLQNVDVHGLEPTYQVTGLKNVVRPDEIVNYTANSEELLKNAPAVEKGHFKVRRMVN